MECQRCGTGDGLEVCLFCGNAFCLTHRASLEGVAACKACIDAEHARKRRARAAARPAGAAASGRGDTGGEATAVGEAAGDPVRPEAAPRPLPEPEAGWWPTLLALAAGTVAGPYLYWLLDWIGQPAWVVAAGTAAATLFTLAAVWAIAKTRLSS